MLSLANREQLKGAAQHAALASRELPTSSNFTKEPSPDSSLVIGVGAGALYMLISCREEMRRLNKTIERTEHLLRELKEHCQHHREDLLSLSCAGSYSMHSTNVRTALSQGLHANTNQKGQLPFAARTCNRDPLLEEQVSATQGVAKDQMADLAAELEAELELMELNINAGDILLDRSLIPDSGEVSIKALQNSYLSDTSSHGLLEASNVGRRSTHTGASQRQYGVSPIELDHRLREVLEAQQHERILELEQLLKETEAKLLAKEDEILGWKNHVSSLATCVQHASACGSYGPKCVNGNGSEAASLYDSFVADVPEVTKNTLETLHSYQDPPIFTQVKYAESTSNWNLLAKFSKQETSMRNHSPHVDENYCNKPSYPSTPSHEGLLVQESNCCWDVQHRTGIDTPVFVVLDEFNAHSTAQKSESLRGQAVSKALEISDCIPPDGEMHVSSHGFNGHPKSLLTGEDGEVRASSGIKMVPSSLLQMSCKLDTVETSLLSSISGRPEELEKDFFDDKHFANSVKLKPDSDSWSSTQEGMQATKRGLRLKNESIHSLTKSLRAATSQMESVEGMSPVLDKIRHYEALVGSGRGK